MNLKFSQIQWLVFMATDRVIIIKKGYHIILNVFDWIHFILAGNNDIHKSLNEFEIQQDLTMNYGVDCPCC